MATSATSSKATPSRSSYRAWFQSINDPTDRYALDEVVYTGKDGALLKVVHDLDHFLKRLVLEFEGQTGKVSTDVY